MRLYIKSPLLRVTFELILSTLFCDLEWEEYIYVLLKNWLFNFRVTFYGRVSKVL